MDQMLSFGATIYAHCLITTLIIRSGPMTLGEDGKEKAAYTARDPPWCVSGENHRPDAPVLGSYTGETSSLGCLEGHWD